MRNTDHLNRKHRSTQVLWPRLGLYRFGGREEPVTVIGLARDGDVRLIDAEGDIRTEPAYRIRLVNPRPAA